MPDPSGERARHVASVYVHAPFCVRRCGYCDFAVTVDPDGDPGAWIAALSAELEVVRREGVFTLAEELTTLYVGGGTPTLLGAGAMAALADLLGEARVGAPGIEWTAEANPESFDVDLGASWRRAGVNRLSLGVQTFHEPALRWMGRLHGPDGAVAAVREAKRAGLDEVSVDLMFGLPPALGRSWADDLARALELDVPHVSLYGLTVEPGTPLGRAVAEGREPAVDDAQYRDEFLLAAERLEAAGYEHYEVSNFARPGHASRHNSAYWSGEPYLGLGNGAHSYLHPMRRWNERDWAAYRALALAGDSPETGREILSPAERDLERIWLRLRTRDGLPYRSLGAAARAAAARWEREGLADRSQGRLRLTTLGWLEMDRLALEIDGAQPAAPTQRPG